MKQTLKNLAVAALMMFAVTALTGTLAHAAGKPFTVGGKKYASLQEAFDNVKSGQTIKLNASTTITDWCSLHKNVNCTLNLNKKTLTIGSNMHMIIAQGTLTVQNGTVKKLGRSGSIFEVDQSASLNIISGTFTGGIDNMGNLTITGGTFSNIKTNRMSLISNSGTLTISGGKFTDSSRYSLLGNWDKAKATISAGTFTGGSRNHVVENSASIIIKGGTFTGKGEDIAAIENYDSCSLTIDGGKFRYSGPFDGDYTDIYSPEWTDGVLIRMDSWNNKGRVTINNGTFTSSGTLMKYHGGGKVQINGGTFTAKAGGILMNANTTKTTISGGTFSVSGSWGLHYNFDEATLTVRQGTFRSDWTVLENYSKNSTINVSGGTFTSAMNSSKGAMVLNFDGTMNIKGGTFVSKGKKTNGFWVGSGKVNLTEGKAKVTAKAIQWKKDLEL